VPLSGTVAGEFGALLKIDSEPLTLPAAVGAYCTLKFPLCPGPSVKGIARPLTLNPAPVTVACEIVKLAVPLFLTCMVCEVGLPDTTETKLALDGVTLKPACTPVPVTAASAFTPWLFVTVRLPVEAPLVVGANFTASVTLCAGAIVKGAAAPPTEIPVPLAAICDTVTLELPVLESCTFCVALLPVLTFPKFTLLGESDIVYVAATPVPFKVMVEVAVCASLVIVIAPVTAPAAVGANMTCNAADCPTGMVAGAVSPVVVNAPPVTAIWLTWISVWPEFVNVTACVPLPFTNTLPKFNAVALRESVEPVLPEDPLSFTFEDPLPREVIAVKVPELSPEMVPVYVTWNFAD
jgi:hypothetical protein